MGFVDLDKTKLILLTASMAIVTLAACNSDATTSSTHDTPASTVDAESPSLGTHVVEADRLLTFDDFEAIGVKHGKDYNIEGLPGATEAALGFYETKDVELRFFPSHEIAVSDGIPVAHEIVGPDARIAKDFVTWIWAIGDQRACVPGNLGGGRDCTRQPKYGDFIVFGNVIMFCEGSDVMESRERCRSIIGLLERD